MTRAGPETFSKGARLSASTTVRYSILSKPPASKALAASAVAAVQDAPPSCCLRDRIEFAIEACGNRAFRWVHVAIARRHREPVRLAHGRHAHDLEGHGKVAHHALDHLELLIILFAEEGAVRHRHQQELGNDGRDTFEMAGAQRTTEPVGDTRHRDGRELLAGIHLVLARSEDDAAAGSTQLVEVTLLIARVGSEILVGSELCRVDEDAGRRNVTPVERALHQADMSLVQGAHGRNQADRAAGLTEGGNGATQVGHRADDGETLLSSGIGRAVHARG